MIDDVGLEPSRAIPQLRDRASQVVLEVWRIESRRRRERQLHDVGGLGSLVPRCRCGGAFVAFGAGRGVVLRHAGELVGREAGDLPDAATS